jgi:CxC2 like cysteine cluster associated with KDZ transposases
LEIHLGHGGQRCPNGTQVFPEAFDEMEWEDIEPGEKPPHLQFPKGSGYLTVVDVTGIHFSQIHYCQCPLAMAPHLQLLRASLFPATIHRPSTAFTFRVLDDFLWDNVECGTAAMNYFSKLRRITSNVFPHLVLVSPIIFMGISQAQLTEVKGSVQGTDEGCANVVIIENVEMEWLLPRQKSGRGC